MFAARMQVKMRSENIKISGIVFVIETLKRKKIGKIISLVSILCRSKKGSYLTLALMSMGAFTMIIHK